MARQLAMPRIFASLAVAVTILILGSGALGLVARQGDAVDRHVLLAVVTLLLVCFIQVVVFTYLTVTGKMIGQAVHIGRLGCDPLVQAKALKRSVTLNLAIVVGAGLLVAATGAVRWGRGAAAVSHPLGALVFLFVHSYVLLREYACIGENASLFDRTLGAFAAQRRTGESDTESSSERVSTSFKEEGSAL